MYLYNSLLVSRLLDSWLKGKKAGYKTVKLKTEQTNQPKLKKKKQPDQSKTLWEWDLV